MTKDKHQCEATIRQYGNSRLCKTTATILTQDYRGDDRWYCKRHAKELAELRNKSKEGLRNK